MTTRMQTIVVVGACLVLIVMAGCGGGEDDAVGMTPAMILDATSGGTEGFYFLAPLVEQPMSLGPFDITRAADLKVDVVPLDSSGEPAGDAVASFTDTEEKGASETIRVDAENEHYIVNFHTKRYDLINGQTYRIFVTRKSDGAEYGFADVLVVKKKKDARSVADDETFVLKNGRTLPIKFWIEEGTEPVVPTTHIVFESDRNGNRDIYIMGSDGSEQTRLTTDPALDRQPNLSPDGSMVAFASNRSGSMEVYVIDIATGAEEQKTLHGGSNPSWSPDGTRIAFTRPPSSAHYICVMDAAGGPEANLEHITDLPSYHSAWSPDGERIAYKVGGSNVGAIWIVELASGLKMLFEDGSGDDTAPAWSPDGNTIAFVSRRTGTYKIHTKSVNDPTQTPLQLTATAGWGSPEDFPSYSPDGTQIAFSSYHAGSYYVCAINADGTGAVELLTDGASADEDPHWSR